MNSSRLVSLSLRTRRALAKAREPPGCPSPPGRSSPDDGVHAPYLRRALEDTQRPGQGVALVRRGQCSPGDTRSTGDSGGVLSSQSPTLPLPTVCRDSGVCRVGAASSWLIGGTPPFNSQAKVKGYGGRQGDDQQQEARSCGVSPSTGRPRTLRGSRRGPTVGRWASHTQTRLSPPDSLRQLVPKPRALLAGGTAEPWRQTPALTLHSR